METCELILPLCWNEEWLDLVEVFYRQPQAPVSSGVQWVCHTQKTLFHYSASQSLPLKVFCSLFWKVPKPWEWDREAEHLNDICYLHFDQL